MKARSSASELSAETGSRLNVLLETAVLGVSVVPFAPDRSGVDGGVEMSGV